MWKLSINYQVPEWAQGKIMYHIFVDRFNRASKEKLPEMPNRTIHESWDEPPLVGPDKNGVWNADFHGGDLKGIEQKLDIGIEGNTKINEVVYKNKSYEIINKKKYLAIKKISFKNKIKKLLKL